MRWRLFHSKVGNGILAEIKVRTFWSETQKIWKNLPRSFDKSADLRSKSKPWGWFFQIMSAS